MTSLGNIAICKTLMADQLGSSSQPVKTIHRASTDIYQNDLNWVDSDTNHTRLRLKEDGHLQIVADVEFFSGPSITNSTKKYSIGLNGEGDAFVVRDEVENVDILTLNTGASGDSDIYSYINSLENKLNKTTKQLAVLSSGITTSSSYNQIGPDILGEAANDKFGRSLALNAEGTRLVVGASTNDGNGSDAGHVRVYQRYETATSVTWSQIGGDIDGEVAGDNSGFAVAIAGDRIAIGAYKRDTPDIDAGNVRVFEWNGSNAWVQLGNSLGGESAGGYFGFSLSFNFDGSVLAIGAIKNGTNNEGTVYTVQWNGSNWQQIGYDIDGVSVTESGFSISLAKNGLILAIASLDTDPLSRMFGGEQRSVIKIYQYKNDSWNQLGQSIEGESSTISTETDHGTKVCINETGSIVAVSSMFADSETGVVRVFEYVANSWKQIGGNILGDNFGDRSGASLSMSNDGTIISVGAYFSDGNPATPQNYLHPGNVKIYQWNSSSGSGVESWILIDSINGTTANDHFGWANSLSGSGKTLAVGCITNDDNGNNAGKAQVFALLS